MFIKRFSLPHIVISVLVLVFSVEFSSSQSTTAKTFTVARTRDPSRGTIIYRIRRREGHVNAKGLRQVAFSRRGPSVLSRNFSPEACDCMDYWDCITNNGHVYSYCGISDSEVCCFYRRAVKDSANNNGSSTVNNGSIVSSSSPLPSSTETIKEWTTTGPTSTQTSSEELLTTGNDFKTASTPTTFAATETVLPSTSPDVDYFYSLENGKGDLKRIPSKLKTNEKEVKINDNNRNFDPICGRQDVDWRLDSKAEFKEWPWHVALLEVHQDLYICGGSLISNDRVITAAHCVHSYTKPRSPKLKVRAGEYDVSTNSEPEPYYESPVERIIIHPGYDNATLVNDIAIIKMKSPLNYTSNIKPICLPSELEQQQIKRVERRRCVVAGWGRLSETSPFSVLQKEIVVPLWGYQQCQEQLRNSFGNSYKLPETAICAGELGHDACDGDGGSGLVCFNEQQQHWSLVGVVSFGIGCGRLNNPGVYTSVFDFVNWITAFNFLK